MSNLNLNLINPIEEKWVNVKDYPNYLISNYGRLKKCKIDKIQKGTDHSGYIRYKLTANKKTVSILAHRLVAEHFIPNPENKKEVNHLGEKNDNRVFMLEWVTHKENCQHAVNTKKYAKKNPITIKNIKTNISINFESSNKCTDYLLLNKICTEYIFYKNLNTNIPINDYIFESENKKIEEENCKDLPNEQWVNLKDSIYKDINVFDKYKASNYGRIKGWFDRVLSPNKNNKYLSIKLSNDEVTKCFKIHRIIIMAFNIPNIMNKPEVDHIDSNCLNNCIENLRWATREDQVSNINTKLKFKKSSKD